MALNLSIVRNLLFHLRKDDSKTADALERILKILEDLDARITKLGG